MGPGQRAWPLPNSTPLWWTRTVTASDGLNEPELAAASLPICARARALVCPHKQTALRQATLV